uniref:Autophagy-related protein n=1 Tax=viral metagenome TaxID=1070528 RepID=A0A6C0KCL8_9ZZZZ
MPSFRQKTTDERRNEVYRLLKKYPDKIPLIIEKSKSCNVINDTIVNKLLVPAELTVGQLLYTLRQRIMLTPEQALFIFFNNQIVNTTYTMRQVYLEHYNKEDEMLYAIYSSESTFG